MDLPHKRAAPCDWENLCFICQSKKRCKTTRSKTDTAVLVSDIDGIKDMYRQWKERQHFPEAIRTAISVLEEAFKSSDTPNLIWHRNPCRITFMSRSILDRYETVEGSSSQAGAEAVDHNTTDTTETYQRPFLRSEAPTYTKDTDCILCCNGGGDLIPVRTYAMHENLNHIANTDFRLLARLQNAVDSIAGDVLYHKKCMRIRERSFSDGNVGASTNQLPKDERDAVFEQVRNEIRARTCRGQAVLLSDCWDRFVELCNTHSLDIPSYFKSRRAFFKEKLLQNISSVTVIPRQSSELEDDIIIAKRLSMRGICDIIKEEEGDTCDMNIPSYNQNEMTQMVHVALYLRSLILSHPKNTKVELTEENAYASVPEALYVFIALMHEGSDILDTSDVEGDNEHYDQSSKLRKDILNICQDMTYIVSGGRVIPPKQYSLGLTVHQQSNRSKKLVQLLHEAKQTISYDQCLQADTALAEETLKEMNAENGAVLPHNLIQNRTVQFGMDNIDCSKESAKVGHSAGFHATQMVAYQPGPSSQIDVSDMKFSQPTLKVPEVLQQVQDILSPIIKQPPYVITKDDIDKILDNDAETQGKKSYDTSLAKDIAFHVSCFCWTADAQLIRRRLSRYNCNTRDVL